MKGFREEVLIGSEPLFISVGSAIPHQLRSRRADFCFAEQDKIKSIPGWLLILDKSACDFAWCAF